MMPDDALLSVQGLTTVFDAAGQPLTAVNDVSFDIRRGETLGLVGESGSGKSVTALAIMGLLPRENARLAPESRIVFAGREISAAPRQEMQQLRGGEISMIFRSR